MEKEKICPNCEKNIEKDFHFCPYCGEALTEIAKEIIVEQAKVSQLKVINILTNNVKDPDTLKLLEKLISMYK